MLSAYVTPYLSFGSAWDGCPYRNLSQTLQEPPEKRQSLQTCFQMHGQQPFVNCSTLTQGQLAARLFDGKLRSD